MKSHDMDIRSALQTLLTHLESGVIPFWLQRAWDTEYGGFLTNFDSKGKKTGQSEKYLNSQCRLLWWFSRLAHRYPDRTEFHQLAEKGCSFLIAAFWDQQHEGWYWKVERDGDCLDPGKVVYGMSFAIYALSEYYLATHDKRGLKYATRTFDLLQIYCTDTLYGGYYESLERNWSVSKPGFAGGDRKSLDTHMHLMESFTALYAVSQQALHRRKLLDLIELIINRMIDPVSGSGRNQVDLAFKPIPAIAIKRTWNAERQGNATTVPVDTTSFGHNVELAWLMSHALETIHIDTSPFKHTLYRLVDHTIQYGIDTTYGGIYRDGTASGTVLVDEKEWWQQAEAMVGFLEAYILFKEDRFWEAFSNTWHFVSSKMINHEVGEWYALLSREGQPLVSTLGNEWKVAYHSGRAMLECISRLSQLEQSSTTAVRQTDRNIEQA